MNRSVLIPLLLIAGLLLLSGLPFSPLQPAPSAAQAGASFPPAGEWYTYANADDVLALARQDHILWAGSRAGGLIRWNTTSHTFVQFLRPQDPLAGNLVYDIAIDPHGFIWLATDHGLSLLDDNATPLKSDDAWLSFTRNNSNLPSNSVTAVAVDHNGIVWIATAQYWDPTSQAYVGGGLTRLDPNGTFDPADDAWGPTFTLENTLTSHQGDLILGLASNNIADILPTPDNRLWIASRQHWLFEQPDDNFPGQWVLAHGGLSRLDHLGSPSPDDDVWQTWNCETDSQFGCVVTQLRSDPNLTVWAAMRGRGVLAFQHDATTLHPDRDRFTSADGLPSNFVDAIAFGPPDHPDWANSVWLSSYHSLNGRGLGVSVLHHNGTLRNRTDDSWNTHLPSDPLPLSSDHGLAGNRVQSLLIDPDQGVAWMGTGGLSGHAYGISPFDLDSRTFRDPLTTASTTLPSNYITAIAFGQPASRWHNHLWLATGHPRERRYGDGALLLDHHGTLDPADDAWSQFTKESTDPDGQPPWAGLAGNNLTAIAVHGDNVWFGARQATWNAADREYTDGGLSVFDGQRWTARTVDNAGLRSNSVTALAFGCDDELWIGLGSLQNNVGAGIDRLDPPNDPHNLANDAWREPFESPPLASNLVTDIAPDCSRSQLWISTAPHFTIGSIRGGGVGRYDYTDEKWAAYIAANGLQSYTTESITGDTRSIAVGPDGTTWIGAWGTTGTSRDDVIATWPNVPAVVNWYRDGIWSAEVFEHDGWTSTIAVDEEGIVWAGTSRGGIDTDQDGHEDHTAGKGIGGIKLSVDGSEWLSWSPANSPLITDDIEVIAVAPDGDVWIGTNGWGLMRFHPSEEPTPTSTPVTPTSTATPSPTLTGTSTATALPPTLTATPTRPPLKQIYLPLIARNKIGSASPPNAGNPRIRSYSR